MKKHLSLVLALLMLIAVMAASCARSGNSGETTAPVNDTVDGTETGNPGTSPADTDAETEKEPDNLTMAQRHAKVADGLPDKKMDGMEFRLYISDNDRRKQMTGANGETGDIVDAAAIRRNRKIEDRFDVKIKPIVAYDGFNTGFEVATSTGEDLFDLAMGAYTDFPAMAQTGYCLDWGSGLPYVDLDKPWYNQSARDTLSVDGHTYVMVGDLELDVLQCAYCIFWNQQFAKDVGLQESIFDVVESGRWTYDYLLALSNQYYSDNGDSIKDENDRLVFAGDPNSAVVTWQYAFDNPIYKTVNGVPEFSMDLEKQHGMVNKLNALYWDSPGGYTKDWFAGLSAWKRGDLLAQTGMFMYYDMYRDIRFDFTIIPYPKYDEEQTNYYSMSDGASSMMAVPTTIKGNEENVSILIEAINAESYKIVTPTYFETVMQHKYMDSDERSIEMMELIWGGVVYDFGFAYNSLLGNISFQISKFIKKNSNDTQSTYDALAISNRSKSFDIIEAYRLLNR